MFDRLKAKLASLRKSSKSRQVDTPAKTERDTLYGKYDHSRDEARHGKAFKGLLERYFGK